MDSFGTHWDQRVWEREKGEREPLKNKAFFRNCEPCVGLQVQVINSVAHISWSAVSFSIFGGSGGNERRVLVS